MRWHKFISTILHPIVMPTIGILIYFILNPTYLNQKQKLSLLAVVFIATYIIPLLLLILLKSIGYIKSFEVHTIDERRVPIFFIMTLLFMLGKFFYEINNIRELSYLFFGVVFGLGIIYLLFISKIKASLHLLSIGATIGFFLLFQQIKNTYSLHVITFLIILSGILASSRLYLKAHNTKEIYLGFFIGVLCPFFAYFIL